MAHKERSFLMIKPDAVERKLVGEIISRFEKKGFRLAGLKFTKPGEAHLRKHYQDLSTKPFFEGLVKFMSSGPVVAMCWEGKDVVATGRKMLGETNPLASQPGTIRGDYCIDVGRNVIHGSDSVATAERELALWFKEEELIAWEPLDEKFIYE